VETVSQMDRLTDGHRQGQLKTMPPAPTNGGGGLKTSKSKPIWLPNLFSGIIQPSE